MARESCAARALRRLHETVLRLRQPARRFSGSVPTTVVISAVLVGAYDIVIGSVYIEEAGRFFYGMMRVIRTVGYMAFFTSLADVFLIYGILRNKASFLHSVVCAALTAYFLCAPLSIVVIVGLTYNMEWSPPFPLWEVPRLLAYPLHMSLMYCLLAELRGDPLPMTNAPPSPDGGDGDGDGDGGWLKSNLAHAGPAPIKGDELLLKVPDTAPVTASCAAAAPVHLHPPRAPAPDASGPLSSSDA